LIETFGDYFVPLMRILDELPDRTGRSGDVISLFEQAYHNEIAPNQYTENNSGNIRWVHNVRWSREKLKLLGFIDAPQTGIWRLTEEGHLWLDEHPGATHLSTEESKPKRKNKTTPSVEKAAVAGSDVGFLVDLQNHLADALKPIIGSIFYDFIQRSNYLQIRLAGFLGCHYEFTLRRGTHEIALHFESSAKRSQSRLRGFEPHIAALGQSLGMPVLAGYFQSRGWTQVRVEKQAQPLTKKLVAEHTDLVVQFVAATFPILQEIYATDRRTPHRSANKNKPVNISPVHKILDQEIEAIRAYLEGRNSFQVSDEKLCDWVNFCYTFRMYDEGKNLFSLVNEAEVNPWYFERTSRIAKICGMRSRQA